MTSFTQQTRVTSIPRDTLHAHRARDTSVTWFPSISRQTSMAQGTWQSQGPFLARTSGEAMLARWPGQAWMS